MYPIILRSLWGLHDAAGGQPRSALPWSTGLRVLAQLRRINDGSYPDSSIKWQVGPARDPTYAEATLLCDDICRTATATAKATGAEDYDGHWTTLFPATMYGIGPSVTLAAYGLSLAQYRFYTKHARRAHQQWQH